jgi:hypothetical protein
MTIEEITPLSASVRMSDADYPGVVGQLVPDWRLVVSSDAKRYTLQQRVPTDAGPRWVSAGGKSPTTLGRIVAKYSNQVQGLAALCASLPDDPAVAAPEFVASVHAQRVAFEVRNPVRFNYGRVVARDGSLRLSVCPDGLFYILQWVRGADVDYPAARWRVLCSAPTLSEIRRYICQDGYLPPGKGAYNRLRGEALLSWVDDFVNGLPESADDGAWLPLPALP